MYFCGSLRWQVLVVFWNLESSHRISLVLIRLWNGYEKWPIKLLYHRLFRIFTTCFMCLNFRSIFWIHLMWLKWMMCKWEITWLWRHHLWESMIEKWHVWEVKRSPWWRLFGKDLLVEGWRGSWRVEWKSPIQSYFIKVTFEGKNSIREGEL